MNTILDMVGSYLIGGLILVSIIALIFYFSSRSQESQLVQIAQTSIVEVGEIIENDFNKLGYRVESGSKISSITDSLIAFRADIDNDGTIDNVNYSKVTSGDTVYLQRSVVLNGTQTHTWRLPIEDINIEGIDSVGAITLTPGNIRSIQLGIQLEKTSYSNEANAGAYWKRRFFPKNL